MIESPGSTRLSDAGPDPVFFIGDSITLGWGDEEIRGWPVRVIASLRSRRLVTTYNLGVRGDTSQNISARWRGEVSRRLRPTTSAALIFAFGANDAKLDPSGETLLPLSVVRDNARRILSLAVQDYRVLFVGPSPVHEATLARVLNANGMMPVPTNQQIVDVSAVLAEESAALGVPYLDMSKRLAADPAWFEALRGTDGLHPPARGHAIIAEHVAAWDSWVSLFAGG